MFVFTRAGGCLYSLAQSGGLAENVQQLQASGSFDTGSVAAFLFWPLTVEEKLEPTSINKDSGAGLKHIKCKK